MKKRPLKIPDIFWTIGLELFERRGEGSNTPPLPLHVFGQKMNLTFEMLIMLKLSQKSNQFWHIPIFI